MAVDTPATIAVLGAGPIGLEAALYARFLGYAVHIYECGSVAQNVFERGHMPMDGLFSMNRSKLGLAALGAQDSEYHPPEDSGVLTAGQWVEQYLNPLSRSDLLVDGLHLHTRVIRISRRESDATELLDDAGPVESCFEVLLRDADGNERTETADVVLDATGVRGESIAHDDLAADSGGIGDDIDCQLSDQAIAMGQLLVNPQPNFYVLGAKSCGGYERCPFSVGLQQIRALFARLGDREDLDLYATIRL